MPTLVPIPKLGQSEETVKIEKWRVKEGDKIAKGDILFEVETDKAVLEVESQFEGTILKILVQEGNEVPVMSIAALIGQPGESIPDIPEAQKQVKKEEHPKRPAQIAPIPELPAKTGNKQIAETESDTSQSTYSKQVLTQYHQGFRPKASPRARKFASEYLINLDKIKGSGGKNGRVTENDVKTYLEQSGYFKKKITPSAFNLAKKEKLELLSLEGTGENGRVTLADVRSAASEKPREFSSIRKVIARRMLESKTTIPHFYVTVSADMSLISQKRKTLKNEGINISYNSFIVRALSLTLKEFPMMNAWSDGNRFIYKSKINIGIAVSLPSGLLVPVIKNADKKALDELQAEITELADKAKNGKLSPDEIKGGTFTISNMGMLNVENFSAIINPGESAILAVSSIIKTPVVKNDLIVPAEIMKMTVSADHRVIDGADCAKFANALKQKIEDHSFWNRE